MWSDASARLWNDDREAESRRRRCAALHSTPNSKETLRLYRRGPSKRFTAPTYNEEKLTTVTPKPNEPVEVALRRFRRSIESTGLLKELRARMAYETPTAKRKRKKAAAVTRLRKQIKRSLPPKKMY
jgi:small subunit ribosomal protein S21